jgi:mannose-6-phosphate isomerase-like protein (cupin superfamily)
MLNITKVHEDERGMIYSLPVEGRDVAILYTNKGYARGGHLHPDADEYFIVLKGNICYTFAETSEFFFEGMSGTISRNEPHYLLAQTNSIILHWGADRKQTKEYVEYRRIVDEVNIKNKTIDIADTAD